MELFTIHRPVNCGDDEWLFIFKEEHYGHLFVSKATWDRMHLFVRVPLLKVWKLKIAVSCIKGRISYGKKIVENIILHTFISRALHRAISGKKFEIGAAFLAFLF